MTHQDQDMFHDSVSTYKVIPHQRDRHANSGIEFTPLRLSQLIISRANFD